MTNHTEPLVDDTLAARISAAEADLTAANATARERGVEYGAALAVARRKGDVLRALRDERAVATEGLMLQSRRSDVAEAAHRYPCDAYGRLTPEALADARSKITFGAGDLMLDGRNCTSSDGFALLALQRHAASLTHARRLDYAAGGDNR
jgi:YD repeat-containing protein